MAAPNCSVTVVCSTTPTSEMVVPHIAPHIRSGYTVLLKPNLVKESHPRDPEGWQYTITSGAVIRAVADAVFEVLGGRGTVVVADAPQTDSCFETMARLLGLHEMAAEYRAKGLAFHIVDLRREAWVVRGGVVTSRRRLAGDPNGYSAFDLGERSEFVGHRGVGRYYGADYDSESLQRHHSEGRHEYLVSRSAILADLVISIPKLKTHKKAGITAALKNLIGINGDKNWLPHHTEGSRTEGGDERPAHNAADRIERWGAGVVRRISLSVPVAGTLVHRLVRRSGSVAFGDTESVVRSGNWYGNDTIWRTCLDLNKILAYGNPDGTFRAPGPENRKTHLVVVDGIRAGEGRGPMNPDPVNAGILLFGSNPPSVDAACAVLMGFDPSLIPIIRQSFRCRHFRLAEWDWTDVFLLSDRAEWNARLPDIDPDSTLHFEPHFGWKGHIERTATGEHVVCC